MTPEDIEAMVAHVRTLNSINARRRDHCRWCGIQLFDCSDDLKHRECRSCKITKNADVDQPNRKPGTIPVSALDDRL